MIEAKELRYPLMFSSVFKTDVFERKKFLKDIFHSEIFYRCEGAFLTRTCDPGAE